MAGLAAIGAGVARSEVSAERVVLVANANDPASLSIARHYMQRRGVPAENLFTVDTSTDRSLSWPTFVQELYNPLKVSLTEAGWIDAALSRQTDRAGRLQAVVLDHRIDFLLLCRLPYLIERQSTPDPEEPNPRAQTDAASVDSELALLMAHGTQRKGILGNPLFNQTDPGPHRQQQVLRVVRLDGPGEFAVKEMIDRGLYAERYGLRGNAYIDKGGPHDQGNEWMEETAGICRELGFPTIVDEGKSLMGWDQRFDAPAIYFGWWTFHPKGVLADRAVRFAPGAIGFHLHSFSAKELRKTDRHWTGPLVDRGISFTVGNVSEPFLGGTHHPHILLRMLADGRTCGEAAYAALPVLSWMAVAVGDPLYRPFKQPLQQQRERVEDTSATTLSLDAYVVAREMRRLILSSASGDALDLGERLYPRYGSPALAYELARLHAARREPDALPRYAKAFLRRDRPKPGERGLTFEMAELLRENLQFTTALSLYQSLLADPTLPAEARKAYLSGGVAAASASGNGTLAATWREELDAMQ